MQINPAQTTLTLSRFVKQAKPELGEINLSALATDKNFATEIVLKTIYHADAALLVSAKNVAEALQLNIPFLRAVELYVSFMHKRDLHEELNLHWEHLLGLSYFLKQCEPTSEAYRKQINAYTKHLDEDESTMCLVLARTFFPFWLQELNPVYGGERLNNLKTQSMDDENIRTLVTQWNRIEKVELSMLEQAMLKQYTEALETLRFYTQSVEDRLKIARFVMVIMRDYDKSLVTSYRLAVDKVHSVVTRHDLKNMMVEVCREFYPFWLQDEDAAKKLRTRVKQREKEESI